MTVVSHIVVKVFPSEFESYPVEDYGDNFNYSRILSIPMLMRLNFAIEALAWIKNCCLWLETYTFPEEAKFSDLDYAKTVYSALLTNYGVTVQRAVFYLALFIKKAHCY